jgi:tetratricopeptide (TPR) repeat protein
VRRGPSLCLWRGRCRPQRRRLQLTIVILAALLALSCGKPIPPVPDVKVDALDSDVRNAIETARNEALAKPKDGQASGHLGMVLEAHTLYQPAVLALQRAVLLDPKEFAWRYYLALALEFVSQPEQALNAVTDALRLRPDYTPAILKRGELLFKLGRFKESDAVLEPLLAVNPNPNLAATLYSLARAKYSEGDFAAAEDLYRRACEAYPTYGAAWYGLAVTGRRLGHTAESDKNFKLAESYKDHNPPADDEVLNQMLKLATGIENRLTKAKQLMNRRQFDEASQLYKEVLKQYPDNPDCLVNLLFIAQFPNQASPAEVEDLYTRARQIDPKLNKVYLYYGTALASEGKYDAAVTAIGKALELKPDDPEAHSWIADIMERQNRPDQAIAQYRAALAVQPSFRPARLELGKILLTLGRDREVIPVLLPALQVDDSYTPVVMMFLAQAYRTTGDRQNALEYLKQAHDRALKTGPPKLLAEIERQLAQLASHP